MEPDANCMECPCCGSAFDTKPVNDAELGNAVRLTRFEKCPSCAIIVTISMRPPWREWFRLAWATSGEGPWKHDGCEFDRKRFYGETARA